MEHSHKYFRNAACAYFPCHKVEDDTVFNCLFCFCPLYLRNDCGGDFVLRGETKDCTGCVKPHGPGGYEHVLVRLRQWREERRTAREG